MDARSEELGVFGDIIRPTQTGSKIVAAEDS